MGKKSFKNIDKLLKKYYSFRCFDEIKRCSRQSCIWRSYFCCPNWSHWWCYQYRQCWVLPSSKSSWTYSKSWRCQGNLSLQLAQQIRSALLSSKPRRLWASLCVRVLIFQLKQGCQQVHFHPRREWCMYAWYSYTKFGNCLCWEARCQFFQPFHWVFHSTIQGWRISSELQCIMKIIQSFLCQFCRI